MTPEARAVGASSSTLSLLAMAGFASLVSMRLCDAMLPALATAFTVSTREAASVVSAFAVTYGTMQLVYGAIGDRYGKTRVIACAAAWCALATLLAAAAPTLPTLSIARAAMGAGAAAIVPLTLAWIGDTVPMARRQAVIARYSGATLAGITLGAWAGGVLTDTLGWRSAFVGVSPLFVWAAARLWREVRKTPHTAPATHAPYWRQVGELLAVPWSRVVLATVFVEGIFTFGFLAFLPTVLHERLGLPLSQGGAVLALFGLGGVAFSAGSGPMLRLLDPTAQARLGSTLLAVGFALLAWMPNWAGAAAGSALGGFGFYTLHNTLQSNATQLSTTMRGLAVSIFACCLFLGQGVGVVVASHLFAHAAPAWFGLAGVALSALGWLFADRMQRRAVSAGPA